MSKRWRWNLAIYVSHWRYVQQCFLAQPTLSALQRCNRRKCAHILAWLRRYSWFAASQCILSMALLDLIHRWWSEREDNDIHIFDVPFWVAAVYIHIKLHAVFSGSRPTESRWDGLSSRCGYRSHSFFFNTHPNVEVCDRAHWANAFVCVWFFGFNKRAFSAVSIIVRGSGISFWKVSFMFLNTFGWIQSSNPPLWMITAYSCRVQASVSNRRVLFRWTLGAFQKRHRQTKECSGEREIHESGKHNANEINFLCEQGSPNQRQKSLYKTTWIINQGQLQFCVFFIVAARRGHCSRDCLLFNCTRMDMWLYIGRKKPQTMPLHWAGWLSWRICRSTRFVSDTSIVGSNNQWVFGGGARYSETDPTTNICSNFPVGHYRRVKDSILSTYRKPSESSSQVCFDCTQSNFASRVPYFSSVDSVNISLAMKSMLRNVQSYQNIIMFRDVVLLCSVMSCCLLLCLFVASWESLSAVLCICLCLLFILPVFLFSSSSLSTVSSLMFFVSFFPYRSVFSFFSSVVHDERNFCSCGVNHILSLLWCGVAHCVFLCCLWQPVV